MESTSSHSPLQALPSFITIETIASRIEATEICAHSSICIGAWGTRKWKEVAIVVGSAPSSRLCQCLPLKMPPILLQRICLKRLIAEMNMSQLIRGQRSSLRDSTSRWECRGRNPFSCSILNPFFHVHEFCLCFWLCVPKFVHYLFCSLHKNFR